MAKLQGPLFSISASGRVGPVLCFVTAGAATRAIRSPVPTGAPSTPQRLERDRLRVAGAAWRSLDAPTLAAWRAYAATRFTCDWITFCREYLLQQCVPPTLPLIPAEPWPAP